MMTSFWAAWTLALAFVTPRTRLEPNETIEHRQLQTMIDDTDYLT